MTTRRVAVPTRRPRDYWLDHRIANKVEPIIGASLLAAFRQIQEDTDPDQVAFAFSRGLQGVVMQAIPWQVHINTLLRRITQALTDALEISAVSHLTLLTELQKADEQERRIDPELEARLRDLFTTARFRFDITNPQAVRWAELHAAELVHGVSEEAKMAVRVIIVRMFTDGMTPVRAAQLIRSAVGLDVRSAVAADNLRRNLERRRELAQLARNEAAPISAQSRAYWRTQRIRTETQIDRAVRRYQGRLLRRRALTIARTEAMAASNAGQDALWDQAKQTDLIPPGTRRQWLATPDERTCPICAPLHHQVVGLGEPFVSPENGQAYTRPPAHPNCRCAMRLVFA